MIWYAVLGLISLVLIVAGASLAVGRTRRYRREAETRETRALADMKQIAKRQYASTVAKAMVDKERSTQDAE
jgi:uncharacterized protein YbjQ (UPF0145 family)